MAAPRPALRVVEPVRAPRPPRLPYSEPPAPATAAPRTIRITGRPDPPRRSTSTGGRLAAQPDRVALWAVLLGVFMVLMAAATAKAREPYRYETLGNRTLKAGHRGSDVKTLQLLLIGRHYDIPEASGAFGPKTEKAVRRFQSRSRLTVDGIVGRATRESLAQGWRSRMATWYGPGLWGNRTACGQTLRHRSWGVAHRTLRCGTRVPVKYGTRIVIAPVIDRGPFTKGITFDLTQRVARALHMSETSRVRSSR